MTAEVHHQDVVAKSAAEARASRTTQERASPHSASEEPPQRPHTTTEIGEMFTKRLPFGSHLGEVDQMKVMTPGAPVVAIETVEDMLRVAEIHTATLVMRTRAQAMLVLGVEEVSPLVREMDRRTSVLQREKVRHLTPRVA
jgi:hypothetical protein